MPTNRGEDGEVLLKAFLAASFKYKQILHTAPENLRHITDLKFGPQETVPAWNDAYQILLENRDIAALKAIYPKTSSKYKADLQVNYTRYSTKFTAGAKPAILNHTHRENLLKVCERIQISIKPLDEMVKKYWNLRSSGKIGEDISSTHVLCPFSNKEYLRPLIEYFLFKGTGSCDSTFPADKLLSYKDPYDPATYKIYEPDQIIDSLWNKLKFSIRSKGMPTNLEEHAECAPWVAIVDGKTKGAFHIRY